MDKAKIEKLLDNLTLGLKADLETRLDVKSELRSHLEAKTEEGIKAGLSEAESEEQALKSFGDTVQISDGIADANRGKMSFKARLKVFAGILLIPSVIICALISFDPSSLQINLSPEQLVNATAYFNPKTGSSNKIFWFFERYTPDEKFILYGDKSKKSRTEQQKAIWERFPDNKAYLANYIIILLSERLDTAEWRSEMSAALKTAEQKDPDNALCNYIAAGLLLEKACSSKSKRIYIKSKNKNGQKEYKTEYSIEIKNRKLMNQAIEEYLRGTKKKYFKTYITDIVNERFDIIGFPKTVAENIRQIAIYAGILLPHKIYLRNIPRSLWLYAEILQKEGNSKEALRIIKPWKIYLRQITEDSDFLIGILVDAAVTKLAKQIIPQIYNKAGETKSANIAEHELAQIIIPNDKWREDARKYEIDEKLFEKTSILAGMLLPALGKMDYTESDFAVSRKIEYTALEKNGVAFLNLLFLLGMTGGLLTMIYWRVRTKQQALLLAPAPQFLGKIFLSGIILPLASYILISISGIAGGHKYNIATNCIALGAQFIILLTLMPAIIFIMIKKHIHQRCLELNIECPEIKKSRTRRIINIIIFLSFFVLAMSPLRYSPITLLISSHTSEPALPLIVIAIITTIIIILYIVILGTEYFTTLFSGQRYALYYGAFAKTLTPVFALAMIFMTLTIIPYLNWREADLISKDKVMYGQSKSLTHMEAQIVQRLKSAMLKAIRQD